LQQDQVDAGALQAVEPLGDDLGRSDQAGAQPSVGDRVLLDRHPLLELRAGDPLMFAACLASSAG